MRSYCFTPRTLVLAFFGLLITAMTVQAAPNKDTVDAIANHFASVPTMSGEFIQFDSNGRQTGGKFFIQRPGKIRFNYFEPSPIRVISNGKTVAVHNKKLKTWDFYPLKKTPLALLLGDDIRFGTDKVRKVDLGEDLTTIVMGDDQVFGKSIITMMFDQKSMDLRQWVIKDAQGKETTVMIFNVEKNVDIPSKLFKFDQLAIQRSQSNPDR